MDTRFGSQVCGDVLDVIDGPARDDPTLRPNQLAAALDDGPLGSAIAPVVTAVTTRLTRLGPRSLDPADERFRVEHRGDTAARDAADHPGSCPFQAWSVAELIRARQLVQVRSTHGDRARNSRRSNGR